MTTASPPATGGRRQTQELTPEIVEGHVQAFEDGLNINEACASLGHGSVTYYRWAAAAVEANASDLLKDFHARVVVARTPSRSTGARTDHIPDRLSADHFRDWARKIVLDTGDLWEPEPFQLAIVRDILDEGTSEVWAVIPEGNAKTTLMAGIALYHAEHVPTASVPVGASSREQAEILFRQAEGMVVRTPGMGRRFRCYEGTRRIVCLATKGRIQIHAADEKTGDGVIPTLALLDELHRHRDLKLYRVWRGKLKKRKGQLVAISTAGEPGSEFETTRDRILRNAPSKVERGAYIHATGNGMALHDYAVRDRAKVRDLRAVKAANPLKAITIDDLREKRDTPTMTDEHWLRFTCNVPTRVSGQAITGEVWDRCASVGVEPDPEAWAIGYLDLGWSIDSTAVGVVVWEGTDRRILPAPRILRPPVDEADVVEAILDFAEEYDLVGFVIDPNAGGQQMSQLLAKGEHPQQQARASAAIEFFEHPQDPALMALASQRFDEALRTRRIVHDGDPGLRAHALNAARKSVGGGEKWRYDRPPDARGAKRAQYPIDALTGVIMGHSVAVAENESAAAMPLVAVM